MLGLILFLSKKLHAKIWMLRLLNLNERRFKESFEYLSFIIFDFLDGRSTFFLLLAADINHRCFRFNNFIENHKLYKKQKTNN